MPDRPTIVCLCGSTRFKDAFERAQREETLAGKIVLSVGMFGHQEGLDMSGPVKAGLDELHKRKIDLADEVLFLNVKTHVCKECGKPCQLVERYVHGVGYETRSDCCESSRHNWVAYIGESTRSELAYAREHGKVIRWLEPASA